MQHLFIYTCSQTILLTHQEFCLYDANMQTLVGAPEQLLVYFRLAFNRHLASVYRHEKITMINKVVEFWTLRGNEKITG